MCVCSVMSDCDSMNSSLPGSTVPGVFQAKILEWVANSYSRRSSQPKDWTHVSCVSCIGRQPLVAWVVKTLPAMQETRIQSLRWEDFLDKGMATLSSILAYRIPWAEEPCGLQTIGLHRVRHDWATNTLVPPGKPFTYLYIDHVSQTTYLYEIQAYLGMVYLSGNAIPMVVFPHIPP